MNRKSYQKMDGQAYRLGFSLAKVAWYAGENLQYLTLCQQVLNFGNHLPIPKEILNEILTNLPLANNAKSLLRNARAGIDARNAISGLIESSVGNKAAAAFRLGFGIVNVMPQLEFLSMGKDAGLSFQELTGTIASQIKSLIQDVDTVGIPKKLVDILTKIGVDPKKAEEARNSLINIGTAIDHDLNTDN